jgi:hypothetical protein
MKKAFLQPGRAYSFDYPRYNYRQLPVKSEPRQVLIQSVRDTLADPIQNQTISSNPFLQRGRWLVTGVDLEKDSERSFYFESMINIKALSNSEVNQSSQSEYIVIDQNRISYRCKQLAEALRFRAKRNSGLIYGIVLRETRVIDLDTPIDDSIPPEFL